MQTVALIDYGSGNLHSAEKALSSVAEEGASAARICVTSSPKEILKADRIVLPGVGAFGACMAALSARDGVIDALREAVLDKGAPFLGICVGMQLLASRGFEHGEHQGLGWIAGSVRALKAEGLKIPHMGWNDVQAKEHALFPPDGDAYFVHSFCFDAEDPADIAATATYGETFPAAIIRKNIAGVQFHPEKSQTYGLSLLGNFLNWEPS
ncbi:imidazole glycerol phosphate synthase subunit HisH [Parvularcula marina]|uniref:Imidazole glycerol phosphate synthase subunit HisH n=1 Tax=Parvularcula marina TaxID=2292771 RepID=A0A371RIA8_9PROT|nr:imidazole glycerol phosphate synthase subunit HisH [Parvularcula marina]RFB05183.1 imidazole glycerol phosphate synthase subunit HisH [Parvularcula marina]